MAAAGAHAIAQNLRQVVDTLVERLTAGEQIHMTVPLAFEVDPELERKFQEALVKL